MWMSWVSDSLREGNARANPWSDMSSSSVWSWLQWLLRAITLALEGHICVAVGFIGLLMNCWEPLAMKASTHA